MSPRLPQVLLALGGLVLALGTTELAARLLWTTRPPVAESCAPLDQLGTPHGLLPPGPHGAIHTRLVAGADGLRSNGPGAVPRAETRLLLVGDSFTFGVGVEDHETVSAALETQLAAAGAPVQVHNGGQLALALDQLVDRAGWLRARLAPTHLVLHLSGNDLERVQGHRPAVTLHQITTLAFSQGLAGRLGEAMVPRCSHDQRPPSSLHPARHAAAWHALGLYLANGGTSITLRDEGLPVGQLPGPVADRLRHELLDSPLDALAAIRDEHGIPVGISVHDLCGLEGHSAAALLDAAAARGLPLLDLSGAHPCGAERDWDLGWDGHPNAADNAATGQALARWVLAQGWVSAPAAAWPADPVAGAPTPDHAALAAAQDAQADALYAALPPVADAATAGPRAAPVQWPWGWWLWPPAPDRPLAWSGPAAAVVLGPLDRPATRLSLSATVPRGAQGATLSCPGHLAPTALGPPGQPLLRSLALSPPLPAGRWLACQLAVDRPLDHQGQHVGIGLDRLALAP